MRIIRLRSSSVSVFKKRKWQKTTVVMRKKLWWPQLKITNSEERFDISVQLLPLLLLKPDNATTPNQHNVSIYKKQSSTFFRLCGSSEFLLAHSAKYPRKIEGHNMTSVTVIVIVSGSCLTIEQEQENVCLKQVRQGACLKMLCLLNMKIPYFHLNPFYI